MIIRFFSYFLALIFLSPHGLADESQPTLVQSYADSLDRLVTGRTIDAGPNQSYVIVGERVIWNEGGEWDERPFLDLKLHLPKLSEKWRLRFTTYDSDDEERGINATRANTTQREENVGLSLFFLSRFENVRTTLRPRVDEDGTSHVLRFRRPSDFWMINFNPRLELFGRAKEGTGQFLSLNMGYRISPDWYFTLVNEEQYTDLDNTMATNQGFNISQRLTDNMTNYYSLIYESSNQPQHFRLLLYTLSYSFEHYVRNRSIVYRLNPNMIYARENNFEGNPSMTFELDFIF